MYDFINYTHQEKYSIIEITVTSWTVQNTREIEKGIARICKENSYNNLIIVINAISIIDSSSIGYLTKLQKKLKSLRKQVVIVCDVEDILMILKVVHLENLLSIVDSVEAAEKIMD